MTIIKEQVILVNEQDERIGSIEKLAAHREGLLHRAFSIFILNSNNEMLLQQRADHKYHSGGLWSNTCCSHPRPGEATINGAHRRLREEMGFDCDLQPLFQLRYRAEVGTGLVENEYDHIYIGCYEGAIAPDNKEVKDYRFISLRELGNWMKREEYLFTRWLHIAFPQFIERLKNMQSAA